jgi:XTP/dITP diphosphohydrolase
MSPQSIRILVSASNNEHKIREIHALLGTDFSLRRLEEIGCNEELPETGHTLEENALQKAMFVCSKYGVPCFADDTGLEVEALNGEPGVYSARYAGEQRNPEDNIRLLLEKLNGVSNRKARFRTVIALVAPEGHRLFEGEVHGEIAREKRGDLGFGYDPVFVPGGFSKTFAEMTLEEKNAISHRSIALQKMVNYLKG